jgi:DNA-binding Lrp family transcriptional regulator
MIKKLDKWDLKILSELEFDYRLSHRKIANKIKRSKAFVTYRIKQMEIENIISYQPLIDYSVLGYTYYRVIIETLLDQKELINNLKKSTHAIWLVERYDRENFVLVIAAKSFGEFQNIWDELYEILSPHILSKDVSLAYKVYHLPLTFLTNHKREDYFITGCCEKKEINEIEKKVLDLIISKPTNTMQSLSKDANIAYNTFKKTILSLQDKKILLAFQTLINKETLNIKHHKLFLSFNFTKKNKAQVIEILKNHKNVRYITETSYHYDLECEIYTDSQESFEKVLSELKNKYTFRRIIASQMKSEIKLA